MGTQLFKKLLAAVAAVGLTTVSASAATISAGSALGMYFNVGASPANITVDYNVLSTVNNATAPQIDFAYYTVNGTAYLLNTNSTATLPVSVATNNFFGGGFQTASPDPTNNGAFTISSALLNASAVNTIGFGVINVNGGTGAMAVYLDNIRIGGTVIGTLDTPTQTSVVNDGSFETTGDFSVGFLTAGNATTQFASSVPDLVPSDVFNFAMLGTSGVNGITGSPPATSSLSAIAANSITSQSQLQAFADTLDGAAVPLPSGLLMAPLGLAVAGMYVARQRRAMA